MKYRTGTFTSAAGAAETVEIGFPPDKFTIWNEDSATGAIKKIDWFGSVMGDDKGFITRAILDDGSGTILNLEHVATGAHIITKTGSTPVLTGVSLPGNAGTLEFTGKEGVVIDADFLTTADVCWWEAWSE